MAKKKSKAKPIKRKSRVQPAIQDHYPEGDARTLADADAIKSDKGRLKKAQTASVKLIKEQQAQLDGLKKILKGM